MKLSKHARIGLVAAVLVSMLAIALAAIRYDPVWLFHRSELRNANEIIARVEAFRASHGRLPETAEEVGMDTDEISVYYWKDGENEYSIMFGRYAMGECQTYHSRTKKWGFGCS